jgi:mono/diheme cytochrome c family protein
LTRLTVVALCLLGVVVKTSAQQPPSTSQGGRGGRGTGESAGVARLRVFDQAAVDRGKIVFGARCASCHSPSGRGGAAFSGPDLIRSVLVLQDANGRDIGQYLKISGPGKGHPDFHDVTDAQIADVATLLHRDVTYAAERANYQVLNIVTGDPKAGEAYFNGAGGCNKCHSVTGDLRGIGARLAPVAIQGLIVSAGAGRGGRGAPGPPATNDRGATRATITLPSGETVTGVLVRLTDFDVTIRDASGASRSWLRDGNSPKITVTNPLQAHIDLLAKYTDADIRNLTAYLVSLK